VLSGSSVSASMRGLPSGVVSAMLRNVFTRALYYTALARAKSGMDYSAQAIIMRNA
jgi:hypothetical protein